MKTEYDIELLGLLEDKIKDGVVKVQEDTTLFFDEIENHYPIGFNRIDWEKNKFIYFHDLKNDKPQYQKLVNEFLNRIINNFPELASAKVMILGDGLTNLGYEMNYEHFVELQEHFFSIPQHTYVWFFNVKKCINLTFEDELFFG